MSPAEAALAVVICSTGEATSAETVASVVAAAGAAGEAVDIVVCWQSAAPPPEMPGARILELLPVSLSYARNRGIEATTAPAVAFVDADEVVADGWARAVLDALRAPSRPAAVFGPIEPRPGTTGIPHCAFSGAEPRLITDPATPPWTVGSGGNMAFEREALLAYGGFDLLLGAGAIGLSAEDTDLIVGLLGAGRALAWSPDMVVFHPTKTASERLASRYPYAFGTGRLIRRERHLGHAARQFHALASASLGAVRARNRRLARENWANWRGFLTGLLFRQPWTSPQRLLEQVPDELLPALAGSTLQPLPAAWRPDPHFIYADGDGLLLHAFVNPAGRLREAIADRELIAAESSSPGIPRVMAMAPGRDCIWVVEERLPGTEAGAPTGAWYDKGAEWAVGFGRPRGTLADAERFQAGSDELLATCPAGLRADLRRALEIVGTLPATHVHGDLEAKNVLLAGETIGLIDWEGAQARGVPGTDLLFLACSISSPPFDGAAIAALTESDPGAAPLRRRFAAVGVPEEALPSVLLVILATWAADERARLAVVGRAGGPKAPALFEPLLKRLGPNLAQLTAKPR